MRFHDPPRRFQPDLRFAPVRVKGTHLGPHHVDRNFSHLGNDTPTLLDCQAAQTFQIELFYLLVLKLAEDRDAHKFSNLFPRIGV
ncbi:MAG: hypothetical protein AABZ58_14645 [Chloroflexota bacterium]